MFASLSAQTGVVCMSRVVSGNPGPRSRNAMVNGLTKLGMFCSLLNLHELIGQQMITCWVYILFSDVTTLSCRMINCWLF